MLPKINRLKRTKDIERVFKEGRGHKEDFLFLKLTPSHLGVSRFAFVVGQKVAKKAVLRNKIKRWLREAARIRLPQVRAGFDVVIAAQKRTETKNFQEIEKAVDKILKKAKIIKQNGNFC